MSRSLSCRGMALLVAVGGPLLAAVGCGHSGIVRRVVYSDDGQVIMYHGGNAGDGTFVADRRGPSRVGADGPAFLSPDGRYVFLIECGANHAQWPAATLVLYDIASRTRHTGQAIPRDMYNPRSLPASDGWEPDLQAVHIDSGPLVTMAVRMIKWNETPPRADDPVYVQWPAGRRFQVVPGPSGAACSNREQDTGVADSWVVVRQPDGKNPFRTVWVHPDGTVIELLRGNQGFGATAFSVIAFPFLFWSPSYWRMGNYLTEQNRTDENTQRAEGPLIEALIARRRASLPHGYNSN